MSVGKVVAEVLSLVGWVEHVAAGRSNDGTKTISSCGAGSSIGTVSKFLER